MEALAEYFANIPSSHRAAILVGGIAFFWLIETAVPFFRYSYKKWGHAWINIFFTATTIVVNFALAFTLLLATDWAAAREFGLLNWLPEMPLWAFMLIGLLLLDLIGAWFAHFVEHKVKWMWRFHLIHHTDPNVDTTTANRHHPGESVIRFVFTTLGAVVCGAPMWLVFMYQSMSVVLSQFNHANIQFPPALERILSYVIVTPRMHRVHHHYVLPYTDSNYGNIFSIWDRLFGTYAEYPQESLVFGIDTHMDVKEQRDIGTMLKIPFGEYRHPVGAKFTEKQS